MRRFSTVLGMLVCAAVGLRCGPPAPKGCNSLTDAGSPDFQCAGVAPVTLTKLQADLLGPSANACALSGCHVPGGLSPTDYSSAAATTSSCAGKASTYGGTLQCAAPNDLQNSTMWLKLLGGSPSYTGPGPDCKLIGPLMPQGGTKLPTALLNEVKGWICSGAPNN